MAPDEVAARAWPRLPVLFSWFGVNLLNIGLHSYGFTDGLSGALLIAYGIVGAILAAGLIARIGEYVIRQQRAIEAKHEPTEPEPPAVPLPDRCRRKSRLRRSS
jgi:hypothetical protein